MKGKSELRCQSMAHHKSTPHNELRIKFVLASVNIPCAEHRQSLRTSRIFLKILLLFCMIFVKTDKIN